jgi:predicted DNA-binding protein
MERQLLCLEIMRSTREDVETIIGEIDDFYLAKILAVGASRAELHEAALAAVMDFEMGERVRSGSSARVDTLSAIIEELLADEEDEATSPDAFRSPRHGEQNERW